MWIIHLAAVVLILVFFGLRAVRTVKAEGYEEKRPNIPVIVTGLALLIGYLALIIPAFGTVTAGHRGVVLRFDATTGKVLTPGAYFVIPFIHRVKMMNVQTLAERDRKSVV